MKTVPDTSIVSRLRSAALLLMSLPTAVALACFAHGHGALGSSGLLAVLVACVAAGALGAYRLLMLTRREPAGSAIHSDFGVVPAAVSRSTK